MAMDALLTFCESGASRKNKFIARMFYKAGKAGLITIIAQLMNLIKERHTDALINDIMDAFNKGLSDTYIPLT